MINIFLTIKQHSVLVIVENVTDKIAKNNALNFYTKLLFQMLSNWIGTDLAIHALRFFQ